MCFRFLILAGLLQAGAPRCDLKADDGSPSTASITWPGGIESPAICLDKTVWFVSVVPDTVLLDSLSTVAIRKSKIESKGKVLFLETEQRLCLLETESALPGVSPFPVTKVTLTKAGQKLKCYSHQSACMTTVAGKDWSYRGQEFSLPLLRLRVADPEEFCSAGTPVVSESGDLVGILTDHHLDSAGDAYAIPASRIQKMVEEVKRFQKSQPVWIGLTFHDEPSTPEVILVKAGSPAQEAGFQKGDIILSMKNEEITSLNDLAEVILSLPAGVEAPVSILRGLSRENLTLIPRFAEISAAAR
ncbi:MAG: serine protease [Verrucomicrobiales bacterium]|nr:serine protease [Verrucomicrobiales bacterium]HQZ28979.1 S1C family serine protease [Verrucomicrobiales bacterium]